jgi:hypothetical protein
MTADPGRVSDRLAILDLCRRKHWIYDHDRWDELDEVFTGTISMPTVADAADPGFDENDYLDRFLVTRADVKRGMSMFKTGLLTQHLIVGHHVRLAADTAVCQAHSLNVHFRLDGSSGMLLHGNDYRFDCLKTDEGWRIRGWVVWIRWSHGDDSGHDVAAKQSAWLETNTAAG